jgi:hypothetical protein
MLRVLLQRGIARHDFTDAMLGKLSLKEPDKHIRGHCVQSNAAMPKEAGFVFACSVSCQTGGTRGPLVTSSD